MHLLLLILFVKFAQSSFIYSSRDSDNFMAASRFIHVANCAPVVDPLIKLQNCSFLRISSAYLLSAKDGGPALISE